MPEGEAADAPYFFLSYAHTEGTELEGRGSENTDQKVIEFYYLLCQHIRHLTAITPETAPGYLDALVAPGTRWHGKLLAELARCQVFVPLYSPRYFTREFCGWEWDAFRRRERAYTGDATFSAIVPVIWAPVSQDDLPACARALQYNDSQIGAAYREHGIYGLMYDQPAEYQRAALRITKSIIAVAKTTTLPACDITLFDEPVDAFKDRT